MTPKSTKSSASGVLLFGCLLTMLAIASIECAATGSANEDPDSDAGPLGALNSFGNFGEAAGLSNMLKSMTDGGGSALTDFMGSFGGPKVLTGGGSSSEKREGASGADKEGSGSGAGFMGTKDPMDFVKLMLNPMEFMTRLAKEFKLDKNEFTQAVGRGMNFGLDTALQPPMVCIKIIEKVFVLDSCKLRFVCNMGKQLAMFKSQMPKMPDSFFEGASSAKAMFDGASGRECEHIYSCEQGEGPKLKKEFAGLKEKFGGGSGHEHNNNDSGHEYAASHQSKVTANKP